MLLEIGRRLAFRIKWTSVFLRSNISALRPVNPKSGRLLMLRLFSRFLAAILLLCVGFAPVIPANSQSFATDLEGKPFDPFRAAQSKVVVLIFVRTDCPISNRYAPTIQQLRAQNEDKAA